MRESKITGTLAEIKEKLGDDVYKFAERVSTWYQHTHSGTIYEVELQEHKKYSTLSVRPQVNQSSKVNFVTDKKTSK